MRERRDRPVAVADVRGLGEEVGPLARVEAALHLAAALEELLDARAEAADEVGDERERLGGEHRLAAPRRQRARGSPSRADRARCGVSGSGIGVVLRGRTGCRDLDQSSIPHGNPDG